MKKFIIAASWTGPETEVWLNDESEMAWFYRHNYIRREMAYVFVKDDDSQECGYYREVYLPSDEKNRYFKGHEKYLPLEKKNRGMGMAYGMD